jgi:putative ABC transport system substrate-binding protein
MRRRTFILAIAAGALLTPCAIAAQSGIPVVGFLRSTTVAPFRDIAEALRDGLRQAGFVEPENVRVIERYADNDLARLPGLAADLIHSSASVIVGNSLAAEAAKKISATVPIVFVASDDPVQRGLATSLARPGGNTTGFTFWGGGQLAAKRLELIRELAPGAAIVGFLVDPNWPGAAVDLADVQAAARRLQQRLVIAEAGNPERFAPAVAELKQAGAGAVVVSGSPTFSSKRRVLIELMTQYRLAAIYDLREFVVEGGLISYSASFTEAYRQAGIYAGKIKILKGAPSRWTFRCSSRAGSNSS